MKTIYSSSNANQVPSSGPVFPSRIASFKSYEDAQRSMDYLADHGFLVNECQIVGSHLRRVEQVVRRASAMRAAVVGALSGIWAGLLVGLMLSLFATVSEWGLVVASTVIIGCVAGVVLGAVTFALTRNHRHHFETTVRIDADHYDLLVEHRYAEWARTILLALPGGLGSWLPPDSTTAA